MHDLYGFTVKGVELFSQSGFKLTNEILWLVLILCDS